MTGGAGERDGAISAQRAFVVHLATTGGGDHRRFSGLVEHLSSGESARFTSLAGLRRFFVSVLDAAQEASVDTSKP